MTATWILAALVLALTAALAAEHRLRVRADKRRRDLDDYTTQLLAERAQTGTAVTEILNQLHRVTTTPVHGEHLPVRIPGEALRQRTRGAA